MCKGFNLYSRDGSDAVMAMNVFQYDAGNINVFVPPGLFQILRDDSDVGFVMTVVMR